MEVEKLKDEGLERHFKIVVPAKEVDSAITTELGKLAFTVKIPGFRPGKVPVHLIKKKYGDSVRSDVINSQIRTKIEKVIKDNKLRVVSSPNIDALKAEEGKNLEFTLKIEVYPEIKMPDFKKIKLEKPVVKVVDKDVDDYLKKTASENVVFNKVSKTKVAKGDEVTLDCIGYIDGKAFEGGKLDGHKLVIGSKTFIPGFEDQLIGCKAGDEVSVNVTFPENYHSKEIAGKASEFKVKIHEVRKPEESEVNDEFAKRLGLADLEALKKRVREMLAISFDDQILTIVKMRLFDDLEASLTFDVPPAMLEREFSMIKAQAGKIDDKEGEASNKKNNDKKEEESYKRIALRRVRIGLLLANYADENKIELKSDDLRDAIMKQARMFPGQENLIFDYYNKNPKALESMKGPALEEKAVKAILDNEVTAKTKEYSLKDIEKLIETENEREVV